MVLARNKLKGRFLPREFVVWRVRPMGKMKLTEHAALDVSARAPRSDCEIRVGPREKFSAEMTRKVNGHS